MTKAASREYRDQPRALWNEIFFPIPACLTQRRMALSVVCCAPSLNTASPLTSVLIRVESLGILLPFEDRCRFRRKRQDLRFVGLRLRVLQESGAVNSPHFVPSEGLNVAVA